MIQEYPNLASQQNDRSPNHLDHTPSDIAFHRSPSGRLFYGTNHRLLLPVISPVVVVPNPIKVWCSANLHMSRQPLVQLTPKLEGVLYHTYQITNTPVEGGQCNAGFG